MSTPPRKGASTRGIVVGFCGAALSLSAACSAPGNEPNAPSEPLATSHERLGTVHPAGATAFPNDQPVYDYFRAKGFTSFQAAGIVGNLDQESGIDPTISQQGGGPGRGIAQWSAGGRWDTDQGDNCVAFAATENASPDTLAVQLDFIMFELQNFPDYGLAKLKATTNVSDAATEFELDFEGCAIASECDGPSRISYATDVLNAYGNDPVDTDSGTAPAEAGTGTGSEAGAGDDSGTGTSGGTDAGSHGGSDASSTGSADSSTPVTATDSGAGGSGSEDGGEVEPAAAPQSSSGCAVGRAGAESPARGGWLVAFGLVLGIARRRRARTS